MNKLKPLIERPYRPCVGLMVFNYLGEVFSGQRLDNPRGEHALAKQSRSCSEAFQEARRNPHGRCPSHGTHGWRMEQLHSRWDLHRSMQGKKLLPDIRWSLSFRNRVRKSTSRRDWHWALYSRTNDIAEKTAWDAIPGFATSSYGVPLKGSTVRRPTKGSLSET